MTRISGAAKSKPQERTKVTQGKILDAAEAVFAELGFENAQLDEVAARAGFSRGRIYAHYASKEEVFLALMEQRVHAKFFAICKTLEQEPSIGKRPGIFKRWIAKQVADRAWGALNLEYKLYAVRRPEARDRLLALYRNVFEGSEKDFVGLLFGENVPKSSQVGLRRRLAAMGGALEGLMLESQFQAGLLSKLQMEQLAEELFDALVHI